MSDGLASNLAALRIERASGQRSSSGKARRWIWIVVAIGAVGASAVAARPVLARIQRPEVEVGQVTTISPAQASIELSGTGYVVPQRVAKVAAKVDGRVSKSRLQEGDVVHAGDVIFELDPADQRATLATARAHIEESRAKVKVARANLAEAQLAWEREKKLVASGAAPAASAEDRGARVAALDAAVAAAEAEVSSATAEAARLAQGLGDFRVVAPIDGVATTKPAGLGDVVTNGALLVELVDPNSLLIEVEVPEGRTASVKPGVPCEVVFDAYPTERYRGEVVALAPRVNRAKATATAKVKLVDRVEELRADMAARVGFLKEALDPAKANAAPKTIIPSAAIVDRGGQKYVFAVKDETVRMQKVSLGEPLGNGFVRLEGPAAGARLVLRPAAGIEDGSLVTLKTQEKGK